jgi:hypothetical protein
MTRGGNKRGPRKASKADRIRRAVAKRRKKARRLMVDLFGLPEGVPDAEIQVPVVEGDTVWRGDQVYPESGYPQDPGTGSFARDGAHRVENLRWGFDTGGEHPAARFRPTTIPTRDAESVSVVFYSFAPHRYAGHAAFLFRFPTDHPVRQVEGSETSQGLVVSVEARTELGQNWGFFQAFFGPLPGVTRYPIIAVLGTWEDFQQRAFELYGRRQLTEYPLDLTPREVTTLARSTLDLALTDHREVGYHGSRRSCTTSIFDILNHGLGEERGYRRKYLRGLVVDPMASTPAMIPDLLRRQGLLTREPLAIPNPSRSDA